MTPEQKEKKLYWMLILSTTLVVALVVAGIFIDMTVRSRDFADEENLVQARAFFKSVLSAWQWNARAGGVYVVKQTGDAPGVSEITSRDGRVLALRSHAFVMRDIARFAEKEGGYRFRFTSLKPLDAHDKPDAFEERALNLFKRDGLREAYGTEPLDGKTHFRYIAPLVVEPACLRCHGNSGYAVGDVLGGISISFPLEEQRDRMTRHYASMAFFCGLAALLLFGAIYWFASQLMTKLSTARSKVAQISIADELTGLYNRRHIMNRFTEEYEQARRLKSNLSCIIADIDHFKVVNDLYGHISGDEVLKAVGHAFKGLVRAYDIVGRCGGEEFLFILPDTSIEQAWHFAERVRMHIREQAMAERQITISLGATCRDEKDQSIDDMIKRADDALFRAKNAGRDRVAWSPDEN
ncbi:MAG TPA: diguanylate cyclase [Nitrospirota bacterium]|nr:diguanylate cyclase [Nitrospirota bacterium]